MISKILCCFSKKILLVLLIFIEFAYLLKLFLFHEDLHNFNLIHQTSQGVSSCYYPVCCKVWSMMRRLIIFFNLEVFIFSCHILKWCCCTKKTTCWSFYPSESEDLFCMCLLAVEFYSIWKAGLLISIKEKKFVKVLLLFTENFLWRLRGYD